MKSEKNLVARPSRQTCSLSDGGGEDHEPPIGTGVGSFFFDIPKVIALEENPTSSGGYFNYTIKKVTNVRQPYRAISSVQVITEEKGSRGRIITDIYKMNESQHAKLGIWLAEEFTATPTGQPNIIIDGDSGGAVRTDKKFTFKNIKKTLKNKRAIHSTGDLRPIKWEIVDERGNIITDGTNPFTAEGDDSYYFYISFFH